MTELVLCLESHRVEMEGGVGWLAILSGGSGGESASRCIQIVCTIWEHAVVGLSSHVLNDCYPEVVLSF